MARFCDACGTPCADNATFCAGCGKSLAPQPAPQQPQTPQYQAPQQPYQAPQQPYQAPQQPYNGYQPAPQQNNPYGYQQPRPAQSTDFVGMIRQYLKIIIVVVAAFAFLTGLLNLAGMYEVSQQRYYDGEEIGDPSYIGVNLLRTSDTMEDFELYVISTYIIGIAGFVGAAFLGFALYLMIKNYKGSKLFFSLGSIIFAAGSLLALLFALFGGTYSQGDVKLVYGVNWTYFVAVILGAVPVVIDKVLFKKDARPLQ